MEETIEELRNTLSTVRQELATTQQKLQTSESAYQSLIEQQQQQQSSRVAPNGATNNNIVQSLQVEVARLRQDLQETDQKWIASERAAEISKREYAHLNEKYQRYVLDTGQKLFEQHQPHYGSPNTDTIHGHSWPLTGNFDSFLQNSLPTLLQMTDGKTEEPLLPNQSPRPRLGLGDIATFDQPSSRSVIPSGMNTELNPIQQPIGLGARYSDQYTLHSEITTLMFKYGNSVTVRYDGDLTTVTRSLQLPVPNDDIGGIDVSLVLTLPTGYPSRGTIDVQAEARPANLSGGSNPYSQNILSESISGLLSVCRWEADACRGNHQIVMTIMETAERWVQNGWKPIVVGAEGDAKEGLQKSSFHCLL